MVLRCTLLSPPTFVVAQKEDSSNEPHTGLSGVTNVGAGLFLSYGKRSSASPVCAQFVVHVLHHAGLSLGKYLMETRENHVVCLWL